jgi:hypothetical protein
MQSHYLAYACINPDPTKARGGLDLETQFELQGLSIMFSLAKTSCTSSYAYCALYDALHTLCCKKVLKVVIYVDT